VSEVCDKHQHFDTVKQNNVKCEEKGERERERGGEREREREEK